MDDMKKCTQCGVDLEPDALFCPDCGTRQEETAQAEVPERVNVENEPVQDAFVPPPEAPPTPPVPPAPAAAPPQMPPVQPFSYNMPEQQNGPSQNQTQMYSPQQPPYGMAPNQMPPPGQQAPYGGAPVTAPVVAPKVQAKKLSIFLLVVGGLLGIGLLFWGFQFFSTGMEAYSFEEEAARGVVFVALLAFFLALVSMIILRVQLKGRKLAILANVLLVLLILVMLFGIAITEFVEGDLLYNLFVRLVP